MDFLSGIMSSETGDNGENSVQFLESSKDFIEVHKKSKKKKRTKPNRWRASVVVHYGSMMSGKTSAVVAAVNNSVPAEIKAVVIKHVSDQRNEKTTRLCTHDNYEVHQSIDHYYESSLNRSELLTDKFKPYDVIAIDEGHFFRETETQLRDFAWEARKMGFQVIVSGLLTDINCKVFASLSNVIAIADEVHQHYGVCVDCGDRAIYTRYNNGEKNNTKKKNDNKKSDNFVLVGSEGFEAVCWKCFDIPTNSEIV